MNRQTVEQLMVPLSEYATVSKDASLYETIMALEDAVESFEPAKHPHLAILVYDKNNRIVGKVNHINILQALESNNENMMNKDSFARLGLGSIYQKSFIAEYRDWNTPMHNLCRKAAEIKIETVMQTPSVGEFVDENTTLDEAIHQLVQGKHPSLLVTKKKRNRRNIATQRCIFRNRQRCERV